MVSKARHDVEGGSTYDAEMFAVCGGVDIMDETYIDVDLGGWLLGWYVVEDDTYFSWRRM